MAVDIAEVTAKLEEAVALIEKELTGLEALADLKNKINEVKDAVTAVTAPTPPVEPETPPEDIPAVGSQAEG
jgi:hypothetical protein